MPLREADRLVEDALKARRDTAEPWVSTEFLADLIQSDSRGVREAVHRLREHGAGDDILSRTTEGGGYMWCRTPDERRRAKQGLGRRLAAHAKTYHSKRGDGQQQLALTEED